MDINKFFKELSMQDYITLGYLYLVILGIININIYYTSFDINIFDYISITDILLAPINMLFLDYKFTAVIIALIAIISYLGKFMFLGINKILEIIAIKLNKTIIKITYQPAILFLLLFSYIFIVLSLEMAEGVSSRINSKTFKLTKSLTFTDNSKKDVRVIATTSVYIFYVEKGESTVNIMPISGNIKSIKDI